LSHEEYGYVEPTRININLGTKLLVYMPDNKCNQNLLINFRNEKMGGMDLLTDIHNILIRRSVYRPRAKKPHEK
jgi:hypothetical protein